MAKTPERLRVPEIIADVDVMDMGDGTYVLECEMQTPVRVRVQDKAGGFLMLQGQIMFTPLDTETGQRLRNMLLQLPGIPSMKGKVDIVSAAGELLGDDQVEPPPF